MPKALILCRANHTIVHSRFLVVMKILFGHQVEHPLFM